MPPGGSTARDSAALLSGAWHDRRPARCDSPWPAEPLGGPGALTRSAPCL